MTRKSLALCAVMFISLLGILFLSSSVFSAEFPQKQIKIIVASTAGGIEDTEARAMGLYAEKQLGVSFIVENQPGAGGKMALEKFMRAEPDGYTLLLITFPEPIILETMEKVNFRTKDLTPVFASSYDDVMLVVNAETWKTFDEFSKAAQTKAMSGCIAGRGSIGYVVGVSTLDAIGIKKINWVPFGGGAEARTALLGKHTDFFIATSAGSASLIRAGSLRGLLSYGDQRLPYFPDVPCTKELGFNVKGLSSVRGIWAPPNTPAAIVKTLGDAFEKVVTKEPAYIEWAKNSRINLRPLRAQAFGQMIDAAIPVIQNMKSTLLKVE
jgi:tripartite-type tricarboxylate transporter receptor subunit TctC